MRLEWANVSCVPFYLTNLASLVVPCGEFHVLSNAPQDVVRSLEVTPLSAIRVSKRWSGSAKLRLKAPNVLYPLVNINTNTWYAG